MKTLSIKFAQFCSLFIALALPTLTAAQSFDAAQWERQVRQQLREATVALNLGYDLQPSHQLYMTQLDDNTYQDVKYTLDAGVSYLFLGVCDNDCSGLQLRLYDGYSHLVAVDTTRGGYPMVAASVGRSGTFYLRVTMRGCRANPCWAGVETYR